MLVPVAAALPVLAALVITIAGKKHAYPPGPRERTWLEPRPVRQIHPSPAGGSRNTTVEPAPDKVEDPA